MKIVKKLFIILLVSGFSSAASFGQATVIILLLGDKVASEELYLRIYGALNIASSSGLEEWDPGVGVNYC